MLLRCDDPGVEASGQAEELKEHSLRRRERNLAEIVTGPGVNFSKIRDLDDQIRSSADHART